MIDEENESQCQCLHTFGNIWVYVSKFSFTLDYIEGISGADITLCKLLVDNTGVLGERVLMPHVDLIMPLVALSNERPRDWSLITGREGGLQNERGGGQIKFYPKQKGEGRKKF